MIFVYATTSILLQPYETPIPFFMLAFTFL